MDLKVCEVMSGRCGTLRAMFDSGAEATIMSKAGLEKIPHAVAGRPSRPIRVHAVTRGEPQMAEEVATIQFNLGGCESIPTTALVVENLTHDLIVGADALEENGMVMEFDKPGRASSIRFKKCPPEASSGAVEIRRR